MPNGNSLADHTTTDSTAGPTQPTPRTADAHTKSFMTGKKTEASSMSVGLKELEQQEDDANPDREHFYAMATRRLIWRNIFKVIMMIIMDVALPVLLYFVLKGPLGNPAYALLIGGVPALLMVVFRLIHSRSVDALGILVFLAFLISAVVAFASGDARILTFEKSLVTLILGVGFIITCLPIKSKKFRLKPFMLLIIKQLVPLGTINPYLVQRDIAPQKQATGEDQNFNTTGDQQFANNQSKFSNAVHPTDTDPTSEGHTAIKMDTPVAADAQTGRHTTFSAQSANTMNSQQSEQKKKQRKRSKLNRMIFSSLFGESYGPSMDKYDWMYQNSKRFRFDITALTLWWGFILFLEFIIRLAMVVSPMGLDQVVTYANIAFGVICAVGGVTSIIYLLFRFKKTKAEVDTKLNEEGLVDEAGMMLIAEEKEESV
ncbi:hypothetical protein INT43_002353 [Umbelopsis isabellina]|uniref:Uncharacterized protein n=1 Tax=Mortierella isabellina TaxID=91625 RepID=A0A8H7UJX9_MORIS|nr:hypothetical protein INT43_002353 [Umbelopsis isabellina]